MDWSRLTREDELMNSGVIAAILFGLLGVFIGAALGLLINEAILILRVIVEKCWAGQSLMKTERSAPEEAPFYVSTVLRKAWNVIL